ncbi:hypothetical protein [Homoserinibacter gongjuensis]|uniref:Uncharacterized protein n=1 Tax=Homoserinibacter gongjuensis TaxID=1162968 RepID=A0ABQ6JWZ7_9MICO|nr:hypothetical protein [Homoserinibacter gongjuensis]GMA92832.1 hypothetical protein GCM10025869_33610 [Homoserinibacter gongjuensis]
MTRLRASEPLRELPRWAVLERTLFDLLEEGWREFERRFCELDGRLRYGGRMHGRDGVDDFYEPFFNWPALYRLGGSDELLAAAKHHWEGVTLQLTEFGFVADEYEVGYDWFHQAESLGLLLGICAADPADAVFRDRARRFAGYYLPGSPTGNYDAATRTIVAPTPDRRDPAGVSARTGTDTQPSSRAWSPTGCRCTMSTASEAGMTSASPGPPQRWVPRCRPGWGVETPW